MHKFSGLMHCNPEHRQLFQSAVETVTYIRAETKFLTTKLLI